MVLKTRSGRGLTALRLHTSLLWSYAVARPHAKLFIGTRYDLPLEVCP